MGRHAFAPDAEAAKTDLRKAGFDLLPGLVAGVVVAVPLVHIAWVAAGTPGSIWFGADVGQMELRTLAASRWHLALGSFSVYGWQHPGPSLYYWFAPFYVALGHEPAGMILATVVANVVGLTTLVVWAGHCGGRRAAWVVAFGVVAFVWRFGLDGLWVSWNPNLTVVPIALLILATAAVVCGHRWMVPFTVLLASWTVQAHVGTALVVGGLCALAVLGAWRASHNERRLWLGPVLAGVAVAVLFWTPPLVDQVDGSHNMTTVAGYMVHGKLGQGAPVWSVRHGRAFGRWGAVKEVGLVGSLLSSHETGRFTGPDRWYARSVRTRGTLGVAFAALVVVDIACARASHRRGRAFAAALCSTAAVASVLAYVSAFAARGNPSHHVLTFVAGIGLMAWIAVALVAVERAGEIVTERWPPDWHERWHRLWAPEGQRHRLWSWVIGAACLLAVMAATVPLVRRPFFLINVRHPETAAMVRAIAPQPGERIVMDAEPANVSYLYWTVLALAIDGYDVRVTDTWRVSFTVEQATPRTWDRSIYLDAPGGTELDAQWQEIGSMTDPAGREVRVLSKPGPAAQRRSPGPRTEESRQPSGGRRPTESRISWLGSTVCGRPKR